MKYKLAKASSVFDEFEDVLEFVSEDYINTVDLKGVKEMSSKKTGTMHSTKL